MTKAKEGRDLKTRKIEIKDVKKVHRLLVDNKPYVGLNSRYTYLLLAKHFSETCVATEDGNRVVAFSSGYIPPCRSDTFFSWEVVVDKEYRGRDLQKRMYLCQIALTNARFLEATINPSNKSCKANVQELAQLLDTNCQQHVLFNKEDFEDDHDEEIFV